MTTYESLSIACILFSVFVYFKFVHSFVMSKLLDFIKFLGSELEFFIQIAKSFELKTEYKKY